MSGFAKNIFYYPTYDYFADKICKSLTIREALRRKAMSTHGSECWWGHRRRKVLRPELCTGGAKGVKLLPIT